MRWLVVVLLCSCLSWQAQAAVNASSDAVTTGMMMVAGYEIESDVQCVQTMLACAMLHNQQAIEVEHRLPQPELVSLCLQVTVWVMGCFLALAVPIVLHMWASFNSMRRAWEAREAELLHRCQGVTEQAYEYAEKLRSFTPSPAGTAAAAALNGTPSGLQPLLLPPGQHSTEQGHPACTSAQSAASTPPAPVSETSAPNLALLVAEAPPTQDAANNSDQLACPAPVYGAAGTSAVKASPTGHYKGGQVPSPAYVSPAGCMPQHPSASRNTAGLLPSPASTYSARSSPNPVAPLGSAHRLLPGGPVAVPGGARPSSSPVPGSTSPSAGYLVPQPAVPSSAHPGPQRWTPGPPQQQPHQQQQQQQQALSCPPAAGAAASTPYGAAAGAQGPAPHSAGQLGGAVPGMAVQHRVPDPLAGPTPPPPAGLGGWVNTSRGSNTPLPFGSTGPLGMGQLEAPLGSPLLAGPLPAGLCTPGTASTTQTAGSLTHVQSIHSTAGSCGGPAATPVSTTPGSTTPMSASSATSGARGSSGASRSPADKSKIHRVIMDKLSNLEAQKAEQLKLQQEAVAQKRAEQQRNQAARTPSQAPASVSPPTSSIRQSLV